ncbi:MAG: hypothetical protein ABI321_13545 [Polyangia bacterium]
MGVTLASRNVVAIAILVGIGSGCGSTNGCASLKPLPAGLTPFGVPNSQVIEGGMQARLTEPGLQKFSTVIENQLASSLMSATSCLIAQNKLVGNIGNTFGWLVLCPDTPAACSAPACGASVVFDSSQRAAPWNIQDGVDKIDFAMADGTNPVLNVEASFDLDVPVVVDYGLPLGNEHKCTIEAYTAHYKGDASKKTFHFTAPIQLGIDPTTGKLKLTTGALQIDSLGLQIQFNNCISSTLDTLLSDVLDSVFNALDSSVGNFLLNLGAQLLQPQIDAFVQSLLPDPLGLAGTIDTSVALASYSPPATAGLETYIVPGGYVTAKDRGLTLGILAGMNSDHDPSTRAATTSSEPDPCVPSRPVIELGAAPFNLPTNAARNDYTLNAAAQFAGMPDPTDSSGKVRDLLLGISRTYFDLIGFHLYNSGSLCLHVDGSAIPALSVGTFGVLVPSLGNIALDPKAPLQLVLRPQKPISFTLGEGSTADALVHMAISDLRIDMYAWIEDRWVRVLTVGLDLNLGLNLTVTKDANMNPVLQPVLSGIDTMNVKVNVSNTDLLSETTAALDAALPSLIGIAAGALTGALPTFALPSVAGFSLDDLTISRVQTTQDDFLGLAASIKTPTSPAPLIDWSNPQHPRLAGEVRTHASIAKLSVPNPVQLAAIFDPAMKEKPALPSVTLTLSADDTQHRAMEYAWKVDTNAWRNWTSDAAPVIADPAFLLQGHHKLVVRARAVGDYRSEDSQPVVLDALIDTTPPALSPHLDDKNQQQLDFGGWDLVSDSDHLDYAWLDESGAIRPFGKQSSLTIAEIGRITNNGAKRLVVYVRDEAGLTGELSIDSLQLGHGSWGRTKPAGTGCGCTIGGATTGTPVGALLVVAAAALWLMRRRLRRHANVVLVIVGVGTLLVGCGDNKKFQCTIDDECSKMQCDSGRIPQCDHNMCGCGIDVTPGDTGRYASMAVITGTAYVAAYNSTYGDLMLGRVTPPGRVTNWDFVDGVPDQAPDIVGSHVRGGVSAAGTNVGQYTSVIASRTRDPIISYYDVTNGALKFASFGAIRWRSHIVDQAGSPASGSTDSVGTWTSMTLDKDGNPGIAYSAIVSTNTPSGKPEGQLRFAQANNPDPQSAADWTITIVDSRPLPDMPTTTNDLLPDSIAIMCAAARKADGTPAITYYDRFNGNLRYAEQDGSGHWRAVILDGEAEDGTDTGDVGQYPSMYIDGTGTAFISYVDAAHNNLLFVDTMTKTPEVADDGYRPNDETTDDGLPSPVYHLVGDSSSVASAHDIVLIAYQDSTAVELRLANRTNGKWQTQTIAGHDNPFRGSYGFWAGLKLDGSGAYVGSYAIDQHVSPSDYFYETFFVDLGFSDVP